MNSIYWQITRGLAVLSLALTSGAVASSAATNPLNSPRGLAVDAKGNLLVANYGGNNIIAFNPGYSQITGDTITQGISNPTGVAFDPNGNLWVANYGGGGGSITEYTGVVQNTANTITNNILAPGAIAIDGVGDIWVQNDNVNVTVYSNNYGTPGYYLFTYDPPALSSVYGIAAGGPWVVFGGTQAFDYIPLTEYLYYRDLYGQNSTSGASSMALDSQSNLYLGALNNTIIVGDIATDEFKTFASLSFEAAGIAIDNVRGRVYVSNQSANEILVFSKAGKLLHTIQ
jgi:DNA-binding beta-propeller fold protein YncE